MNNDYSDLGGSPADFSDLGGTPEASGNAPPGPKSEIGPNNMGAPLRGVSDTLRSMGQGFIPDVAADVYELGRGGVAALTGNTKGYGHNETQNGYTNYVTTENPFRSEDQTQETRNQKNPVGAAANVGKDVLSYVADRVPILEAFGGGSIPATIGNRVLTGAAKGTLNSASKGQIDPATIAGFAAMEPLFGAFSSGMLTKGGVARKATQAAEEAASQGKGLSWSDLQDKVKQAVLKDHGNTAQVRQAFGDWVSRFTPESEGGVLMNKTGPAITPEGMDTSFPNSPTSEQLPGKTAKQIKVLKDAGVGPQINIPEPEDTSGVTGPLREPTPYSGDNPGQDISNPHVSAADVLQARRLMSKQLPQNFFQKLMRSGNTDDAITNTARRVYSENLHKLAPGTVTPDKLYHIYSTILGKDAAGLLVRLGLVGAIGGGAGIKHEVGKTATAAIQ